MLIFQIIFYNHFALSNEMVKGEFLCPSKGPKALLLIIVKNSWIGNTPTIGYHINQEILLQMPRGNHYSLKQKHTILQVSGSQYHLLWMHFTGFLGHIPS